MYFTFISFSKNHFPIASEYKEKHISTVMKSDVICLTSHIYSITSLFYFATSTLAYLYGFVRMLHFCSAVYLLWEITKWLLLLFLCLSLIILYSAMFCFIFIILICYRLRGRSRKITQRNNVWSFPNLIKIIILYILGIQRLQVGQKRRNPHVDITVKMLIIAVLFHKNYLLWGWSWAG